MKQLKQIEIQGQDSAIQPGNVVRLLQPFRPERYSSQEYALAIVVGIVRDDFISRSSQSSSASKQIAEGHQLRLGGVVVYLYEPQSATIYLDHSGTQALFSFDFDEIEPMPQAENGLTAAKAEIRLQGSWAKCRSVPE